MTDDPLLVHAERERFREALRVIAEGEYASEAHAASYARRALDRSTVLPSLARPKSDRQAPALGDKEKP